MVRTPKSTPGIKQERSIDHDTGKRFSRIAKQHLFMCQQSTQTHCVDWNAVDTCTAGAIERLRRRVRLCTETGRCAGRANALGGGSRRARRSIHLVR